ncbi:histidinolphosphatase [Pichia californica]|uniref:Histidinol-phosphatase n=1 Tax=Pichia californica TaxID=460514 RepID=A0A9P7BGT9_9ASCO|nr:histidinolphosphatase [[Candida] californica]KAG0689164.1 histidinolphosphatase [[Candida] californica]
MPYSHHSHSGSYCKHAHDTLDSVIETAQAKNFKIFCLTEHVPRLTPEFLYPEELEQNMTPESLMEQFQNYVISARIHQKKVNNNINNDTKLLVGFESEGGINEDHLNMCMKLRKDIDADLIIGSIHHVNGTDIDFDQQTWDKAVIECEGIRGLYREYFKLLNNMIYKLKPQVVAHFDLIRLFANTTIELENVENGELIVKKVKITQEEKLGITIQEDWPDVWSLIEDSIDLIVKYNLTVELNSSAIRKGWNTPYPKDDIMKTMISKGVKFVLSDDSHGDDQVGLNYQFVLEYIKKMKLEKIYYHDIIEWNNSAVREGKGEVVLNSVTVDELIKDDFWKVNYPSLFNI